MKAVNSVGVFIPVPLEQAPVFPFKEEDPTVPHCTVLVVGPVLPVRLIELEGVVRKWAGSMPAFQLHYKGRDYFEDYAGDRRIYFSSVQFSLDLARERQRLVEELILREFDIADVSPFVYRPHITLEYCQGVKSPPTQKSTPEGSFTVSQLEIWDGNGGVVEIPLRQRVATKSKVEKEDEEVRKLVKKPPTKKPPRNDLRDRRVREDDPDMGGVKRKTAGLVNSDKKPKSPGDFWQTEKGWGAVNPEGVHSGTESRESAEAWAKGGKDKKPSEPEPKPQAKAKPHEMKSQSILGTVDLTAYGLEESDRKEVGDLLGQLYGKPHEQLIKDLENYDPKKKPKDLTEKALRIAYDNLTSAWSLSGKPAKKAPSEEELRKRSRESFDSFDMLGPNLRKKVLESLVKEAKNVKPKSPEYYQLRAVAVGVGYSQYVKGEEPNALGKSLLPQQFESTKLLAKKAYEAGKHDFILGGLAHQSSYEGRKVFVSLMSDLSDNELAIIAGGPKGPLGPFVRQITKVDKNGIPVGRDNVRRAYRDMIVAALGDELTYIHGFLNNMAEKHPQAMSHYILKAKSPKNGKPKVKGDVSNGPRSKERSRKPADEDTAAWKKYKSVRDRAWETYKSTNPSSKEEEDAAWEKYVKIEESAWGMYKAVEESVLGTKSESVEEQPPKPEPSKNTEPSKTDPSKKEPPKDTDRVPSQKEVSSPDDPSTWGLTWKDYKETAKTWGEDRKQTLKDQIRADILPKVLENDNSFSECVTKALTLEDHEECIEKFRLGQLKAYGDAFEGYLDPKDPIDARIMATISTGSMDMMEMKVVPESAATKGRPVSKEIPLDEWDKPSKD